MKNIITFILTLVTIYAQAQILSQQSVTEGFSVQANLGYAGWNQDEVTGEFLGGAALSISVAYGFNEHIQGFAEYMYAPSVSSGNDVIDAYPIQQSDLGARFIFGGTTAKWRPYLQASVSNHTVTFDDDIGSRNKLSGVFLGVGGGTLYYFQPNMAINLQAKLDFGTYDSVSVNGQELGLEFDANTSRLMVGFTYLFE